MGVPGYTLWGYSGKHYGSTRIYTLRVLGYITLEVSEHMRYRGTYPSMTKTTRFGTHRVPQSMYPLITGKYALGLDLVAENAKARVGQTSRKTDE